MKLVLKTQIVFKGKGYKAGYVLSEDADKELMEVLKGQDHKVKVLSEPAKKPVRKKPSVVKKQEEPKKEEPKQEEPKKEEPKQEAPKRRGRPPKEG